MNISLGIYEKAFPEDLNLAEILSISKTTGYDFFELSIDRTDKRIERIFNEEKIREIKEAIERTKHPIETIGLSALGKYTLGNINDEVRNKGIEIFKHAVLFAKKIGCRIIQIPACDMQKFDNNTEETHEIYIKTLKQMIEYASKEGVLIGLENMENNYADTVEKCMRIINSINSPYLQLFPDSGNISNASIIYGTKVCDDMNYGKGKYIAFHLKEVRKNKYGGLFYGDGIVEFPKIVEHAYSLGVRRFTMEYWYTGNNEWKNDLIEARNKFISWVDGI